VLDASGQALAYVYAREYARETEQQADIARALTFDETRRPTLAHDNRLLCFFSSEKVASLGAAASPSSALRCRQDFARGRYRLTPRGGKTHSLILGRRQIRRPFSGWRTLEPVAFVTGNIIQEPANDRSQSHCAERSIYWQHLEIPRVVR